jgi:hypothetical protein
MRSAFQNHSKNPKPLKKDNILLKKSQNRETSQNLQSDQSLKATTRRIPKHLQIKNKIEEKKNYSESFQKDHPPSVLPQNSLNSHFHSKSLHLTKSFTRFPRNFKTWGLLQDQRSAYLCFNFLEWMKVKYTIQSSSKSKSEGSQKKPLKISNFFK